MERKSKSNEDHIRYRVWVEWISGWFSDDDGGGCFVGLRAVGILMDF